MINDNKQSFPIVIKLVILFVQRCENRQNMGFALGWASPALNLSQLILKLLGFLVQSQPNLGWVRVGRAQPIQSATPVFSQYIYMSSSNSTLE